MDHNRPNSNRPVKETSHRLSLTTDIVVDVSWYRLSLRVAVDFDGETNIDVRLYHASGFAVNEETTAPVTMLELWDGVQRAMSQFAEGPLRVVRRRVNEGVQSANARKQRLEKERLARERREFAAKSKR